MADRTLYLVFGNPADGRDDDFNEWYDNVHIPDVLSVPGVVSAQRYSVRQLERDNGRPADHGYLTVYELDGDPDEFLAKMGAAVASGEVRMSDVLDRTGVAMSFWTPLGPKTER